MALSPRTINPIDLKPQIAVGINIPFSEPSAITANYTTKDAAKNNIINYVLTNANERMFRPGFGANLRSKIFDLTLTDNDLEGLGENLKRGIEANVEGVNVTDISFAPSPDEPNDVNFYIKYKVLNSEDVIVITI